MAKVAINDRIGNASAVLCGQHGDVTAQAERVGCSRQTVYDHAHQVEQAVADAQIPGPCRSELLQQVAELREENRRLKRLLDDTIDFYQAKQQQFTTTAGAMGLSLGQILALLAVLLPEHHRPSRATLGRWLKASSQKARRLLPILDKACRALVLALALDEIFFKRQVVLMGVEPYSLAWLIGQRAPDRSGETWAKALAPWHNLADVAADGGTGMERGLKLLAAQRQQEAAKQPDGPPALPLHVRLDVFHIRQEGARAQRQEWAAAQKLWETAEKTEKAKARFDRSGKDKRQFNRAKVEKAWAAAEAAFEEACRKEKAWERAVAALAVRRPDGQLNSREWAEKELQAAAAELTGKRWAKVRRQLLDRRALTFLDRLHEELAQAEPSVERREALVALWRWRSDTSEQRKKGRQKKDTEKKDSQKGSASKEGCVGEVLLEVVRAMLGPGWKEGYKRVCRVLSRVLRASSAVEGLNSVVRMHQARHRNLSQGLLDLKRLFWNCRTFAEGKRKDCCPYELLGLLLPSYDPWVLLNMDPQLLDQLLSTLQLAP